MASKSGQPEPAKADVEELLDVVDKALDRVKVLYEQYFLGMQKQPPTQIHTDVERRLRDLQQMQIRNTGLRYRFATLQQKFGSYNSYWRRTLRQIENGTYIRNLSKISRRAAETGEEIPEEILAAMPKRMRDQVKRDREVALATARRRDQTVNDETDFSDEEPAFISEVTPVRMPVRDVRGAHVLDDDDGDLDIDAFFASVTNHGSNSEDTQENIKPFAEEKPTQPANVRAAGIGVGRPTARTTGQIPVVPAPAGSRISQQIPAVPAPAGARITGQTPIVPAPAGSRISGQMPIVPAPAGSRITQPVPTVRASQGLPAIPPDPRRSQPIPAPPGARAPTVPAVPSAPSQGTRPNPVVPGSSTTRPPVPVESMAGPFPRVPQPTPTPAPARPTAPRPAPPSTQRPPPGMNDADVNALHAKYLKAKEMVGETPGPGSYAKLLQTINAQAPKIMEQYKAKGVEFSVVVKDNQVIIKAKPKT